MPERNPSPKAQFLADKANVEMHASVFSRPAVQGVVSIALAQYHRSIAERASVNDESAAALHFKAKGAQEFVSVLMNLGESPVTSPAIPADNLNHRI